MGIPISLKCSISLDWMQILGKINAKFTHWGSQWLNLAGQIVLIKIVFFALPLYQFFVLLSPKGIINQISSKIR
jgi:hypothetical protein